MNKNDVTVVVDDRMIIVDGRAIQFDFNVPTTLPHNLGQLHALQWHNNKGELEYPNAEKPQNILFGANKYNDYVKPFVDLWEVQREIEDAPPPVIEIPLAELKKNKKLEAKREFDTFSKALVEFYSDMEIASFYKQELDAQKYKDNPQIDLAQIPYVAAIAENREVPLAGLVNKILEKSYQIAPINGALLGKKQRIEDLVDACVDASVGADAVKAIAVREILNAGLAGFGLTVNEQGELAPLSINPN